MIHFQDESLPLQSLHCFWPASRLFIHSNCKYIIFRTNQQQCPLCFDMWDTKRTWRKMTNTPNVGALKMRKTRQSNGVKFQHNKILICVIGRKMPCFPKGMLSIAVVSGYNLLSETSSVSFTQKHEESCDSNKAKRKQDIFTQKFKYCCSTIWFFYTWQIFNCFAFCTLQQKYIERYLLTVI